MILEAMQEISASQLEQMAAVLEDRLLFVPDVFQNATVVDTGIHINLPFGHGRPANQYTLIKPGQFEIYGAHYLPLTATDPVLSDQVQLWDDPYSKGGRLVSDAPALLTQDDIVAASGLNGHMRSTLTVALTAEARARFEDFTDRHIGQWLAFVFDGQIVARQHIAAARTDGRFAIEGNFGIKATELARIVQSGPLSHPLKYKGWQRIPARNTQDCADLLLN
jgi:preprotein translocase subunit SecD